ncbi:MAG: hypothetical protein HY902_13830 [Deltaproteobacteria bacterium]|nr:hypothetical protein [Deltaproteobacteria bacterium]
MVEPIFIGAGRIGRALARRAAQRGLEAPLLGRHDAWDVLEAPQGQPIALCVRNDDLGAVLARVPAHRHTDLVFLQNGMLRDWLREHDLELATRGLLFFAVPDRNAEPQPGGVTPLWGPHAQALAGWLRSLDLPAEAVHAAAFANVELEKLLWNTCLGVVCQARHCSVAQAATAHAGLLAELAIELARLGRPALGADVDDAALVERMVAYSVQLGDYRAAVKEWPWRNGWFVAEAARLGRTCPVHGALLAQAGIST